jgi:ATP-binding cassette subfamily F protein uup
LARLLLARGLRQPSNVLVMDEPTNDLDLETLDLLQEMIAAYEGTVILVSHDRDFLDRTVSAVFHTQGDGTWLEYAGGYSDMKAQQKMAAKAMLAVADAPRNALEPREPASHAPRKAAVKMSYKDKFRLENLPAEMDALRGDIAKAEALLNDASLFTTHPEKFDATANKLHQAREALAAAEEEWLTLEMHREALEVN